MLHLSEARPATFQLLAALVGKTLRSLIDYAFKSSMPMVSQMQHPQSLNFTNQKKAYILRNVEKLPFRKIAKEVKNLQKRRSTEDCVRRTVARFSVKRGMSKYKYENSGRSAWKLTPEIKKWLIKTLYSSEPCLVHPVQGSTRSSKVA